MLRRYMSAAAVVMVVLLTWSVAMAQSHRPRVVAEFPGVCVKWVRAAEPEIQRVKLDLADYRVEVVEDGESVIIVLISSDAPKNTLGSGGTHVGYEVEISKKDMRVMRSNFVQ